MKGILWKFTGEIYFLMLISVSFILLTLRGLIIFGISPAATSLMRIIRQKKCGVEKDVLKSSASYFKTGFKKSNLVFYTSIIPGVAALISAFFISWKPSLAVFTVPLLFTATLSFTASIFSLFIESVYEMPVISVVLTGYSMMITRFFSACAVFTSFLITFILIPMINPLIVLFIIPGLLIKSVTLLLLKGLENRKKYSQGYFLINIWERLIPHKSID